MTYDLKGFAQRLFDSMVLAADNGIDAPMTFLMDRDGEIVMESLPAKAGVLLSNGAAKDELFAWWRSKCQDKAVRAWACGSWAWMFALNEAGRALDPAQFKRLIDHGFKKLTALGYGEIGEALVATAQTRERVLLIQRPYKQVDGKLKWIGEPVSNELSQDKFKGLQKMWGDLKPENLS